MNTKHTPTSDALAEKFAYMAINTTDKQRILALQESQRDLLEALQWATKFLDDNFSDSDMPELKMLRAVIAKTVQS